MWANDLLIAILMKEREAGLPEANWFEDKILKKVTQVVVWDARLPALNGCCRRNLEIAFLQSCCDASQCIAMLRFWSGSLSHQKAVNSLLVTKRVTVAKNTNGHRVLGGR